jgi:hypothetical protein
MDDNIRKKLDELSKESETIIANPDDIEKLKDQGLPIRVVPSKTILGLFQERLNSALDVAQNLPILPDRLPPAIKSLYQEIRWGYRGYRGRSSDLRNLEPDLFGA